MPQLSGISKKCNKIYLAHNIEKLWNCDEKVETYLQPFGSVNCTKRSQNAKHSKNFHSRNFVRARLFKVNQRKSNIERSFDSLKENGDERDAHDEQVEKVEGRSTEGSLVEDKPVRYEFQQQLDCEHRGEEVIEIVENLWSGKSIQSMQKFCIGILPDSSANQHS